MSSKRTPLTEDQKIFEIEERVYKLLSPELRIKYTAYRKVPVYPKEFRQPYGPRTTEYFDTTAERIATGFTLNSGSHLPTIKTIEIEEDLNTKNDNMNNINMQDLAQIIATAVANAMQQKPNNESSSVKIPIPSTYNGERSASAINLWIQEVERYLKFYHTPENTWISFAVTLLRSRAQKWWNNLVQKELEPKSWEQFKYEIDFKFKPAYSEHTARDRLANVSQTASVSDYVDLFQDIMLDLPNISDDEALDRFVRGLKNEVRIHVITRDLNTLEDATRFAIAYESAQQVGMVMPSRKREELPNDPMDLSVLVQQLNALVRSGNNNISNNNNHFNNRQSDRRNFNSGRRSNIICHWCNKSGHVIAECRTRQRDIREFEQTKLRQKRSNFQPRARPNQAYVADLIDIEASNNSVINKNNSDMSFFNSVNKESLLDLSPYSHDFLNDAKFLLNTALGNTELPVYEIFIKNKPVYALIDSGASANYIHPRLLHLVDSCERIFNQAVETANGDKAMITSEITCTMEVRGKGKAFINTIKAYAFESKFDLILGNSWLKQVKPKPDWFNSSWTITLPDQQTVTMESVKKQDKLLLSAKQVERLIKTNQVDKCYLVQIATDDEKVSCLNNINEYDESWADEFNKEFPEVFKGEITGLPPMRDTQDIIVTHPDATPVSRPPYKMSPLELTELRKQLDGLLKKGLIEPCASEWSNPVLFVRKPNGELRMCCDYRMLNKVTLKQKIQLPRIDECLERLHSARHFTSLDLTNGFHQQRLSEADSLKTSISTRYGQFRWKVVPFGLSNSGPAFQKMMNSVLTEYIDKFVTVYLDDILIFTNGDEDLHKKHVRLVLKKLEEAKLIINKKKCSFNRKELTFLGYHISAQGIKPAPNKVNAILSWPVPTNVQQVRQFIGLAQHYRKFIPGFADIASPLTDLTKGSGHKCRTIRWTDECQKSFDLIKKKITTAPVLITPDMNKPFRIECDASDYAIGAVLLQEGSDGIWRPLAYESKKLSAAERNYPAQERELLSILHALRTWRCFIEGNKYEVYTDHLPLKYLRSQSKPTPRLVRWLSEIELYDPVILYKPGVENQVPDILSRRDTPDTKPSANSMEPKYLYNIVKESKHVSILDSDPIQDWPLHYLSTPDKWPIKIKKELEKRQSQFIIRDKQVFKKVKLQGQEAYDELKFIPFAKRADLVDNFHRGYGHSGQTTVYNLMKSRIWWPKMQEDVTVWISRCPQCQLTAPANKHKHLAPMKPLEVPPAFTRWHLDFIGELPTTKNNNRWILMAVDYTTNWPIARALNNATAEEIVKFIYEEIVMRFGCPQEILTDRGANFMAKVVKQYIKKIKAKHVLTSAFHPRTNGKCERLNQTFKKMLTKYVNGEVHNWDEHIDAALFACRIRKHSTTGFSPFFLTYGVEPRIPGDIHKPYLAEFLEQDPKLLSQDALIHLRKLRESRHLAEDRLKQQAIHDKKRWDSMMATNKTQTFNIGDYVLMRHESKQGLEFNWMGPYKVINRNLDYNTYQLQEINGKLYASWVHTDRLHAVKYDGASVNKTWYIPRIARNDSENKLNSSLA